MAGVPIYNYDLRNQQVEVGVASASTRFDWVVVFRGEGSNRQLQNFCGKECKALGHPDQGGAPFVTLQSTEERLVQLLEQHPGEVDFVEPDMTVSVPEDIVEEAEETPWHLGRIGVPEASYTGKGVHIYVMDTGVRTTHEDFGGRAIPTVDTIAGKGAVVECDPSDPTCSDDYHGHGTHVAGSAGGTVFGVAKEATLYSMKVCCGAGTNVLAGYDWAARNGIRPAIVTVSLASSGTWESARVAVDRTVASGVTVFVGAANDNVDTCTMTYGFIPSAISVGATDINDKRAVFSNWGPCNDIYAPGVAILSAWLGSDTDTKTISGTSMATPLTAGAGALLLEEDPTLTPAALREKMRGKAIRDVITDLKEGDPNLLLNVV